MLDSIQIEVTSRCFLKCVMCPNITLPKWDSRDMDFETFTKISKYFPYAKLIYLQGMGREPLLHARIFDLIRMVKNAECRAGFTTNGIK